MEADGNGDKQKDQAHQKMCERSLAFDWVAGEKGSATVLRKPISQLLIANRTNR